ncbi:MAG TPA: type IV secretory system conjugative DNA transfer family protein, partial [Jatrophihabitantaceae bacterium]|nr:type IV secretory system conjugative DNA transfer family protein [Jatrophihabitantaceae bacterium]
MTEQLREALAVMRFNSVETPDDVWHTSPFHVDGLHARAEHRLKTGIADAATSTGPSPVGLVLQGQKGVGKTHLLGSVRRMVQQQDGYFFLVELTSGDAFWDDVAEAMRSKLRIAMDDGDLQLTALLRRLCRMADVPADVERAIVNKAPLTPANLRAFINALRTVDGHVAVECGDVIRALALYASEYADVGLAYLQGVPDVNGARRQWGMAPTAKPSRQLVRDISRVLALTGPCVIAVDQLDTLVNKSQDVIEEGAAGSELTQEVAVISDGLMQLRETTRRTLTVVACLPSTWMLLNRIASDTVEDRFTLTPILASITDPAMGRALVEKWLGVIYQRNDIVPPHPTWPVAPSAFGDAWVNHTPRQLLKRIHTHAEACLYGEIRELGSFDEELPEVAVAAPSGSEQTYFADFDAQFARLREKADISAADLKQRDEDEVMPDLLLAGLKSWITEVGNDDLTWHSEAVADDRRLHAGLRRTVNEALDTEERWGFRFIASGHGIAVLHRMRRARAAVGLRPGGGDRHLVLIRNGKRGWTGAKTRTEFAELERTGGRRFDVSDDDLRTFSALKEILATPSHQLHQLLAWLVARKPASSTTFLREVLPNTAETRSSHETRPPPMAAPASPIQVSPIQPIQQTSPAEQIVLGIDGEVRIELESLRKHAIVFAGSGSGKTVLLRRIIEECALRGVSAIVLDPNNDLARLGDAWPQPPADWLPSDADRSAEYLATVEVVVWTPGRAGGRPLSFHPLPDFAQVREDADEFAASIDAAVARLGSHARVANGTKIAARGQAVLRQALNHYAHRGDRDLSRLVEMLADLPD